MASQTPIGETAALTASSGDQLRVSWHDTTAGNHVEVQDAKDCHGVTVDSSGGVLFDLGNGYRGVVPP